MSIQVVIYNMLIYVKYVNVCSVPECIGSIKGCVELTTLFFVQSYFGPDITILVKRMGFLHA